MEILKFWACLGFITYYFILIKFTIKILSNNSYLTDEKMEFPKFLTCVIGFITYFIALVSILGIFIKFVKDF